MAVVNHRLPKFYVFLFGVLLINGFGIINSGVNGSVLDSVKSSLVGTAHAESEFFSSTLPNGTGCWNASFTNNLTPCPVPADESINICIKENTTYGLPVYYYLSNSSSGLLETLLTAPAIGQSPPVGLNIDPILQSTTSPYLTDYSRVNYLVNLTAPAVSFGSSPILTTVTFDGDFSVQTGGGQTRQLSHSVTADVRMEHVNTGPVLTNLSPVDHTQKLPSGANTTNLQVSADYSDNENNHSNVIFELTNDNFSTILQTQTVSNVASGTTLNTTFTNLGVGDYQWRVRATETDATGNCIGYPNEDPAVNLSTVAGPTSIRLTSGDTLAPTGADQRTPLLLAIATILAGLVSLAHVLRKPFRNKF